MTWLTFCGMASRKLEPRVGEPLPGESGDVGPAAPLGLPTFSGEALLLAMPRALATCI